MIRRLLKVGGVACGTAVALGLLTASFAAQGSAGRPLESLPSINVPDYLGTWYQVAWFPNQFQRQCVSDTQATYRDLPDGKLEVLNRCTVADGQTEEILGVARPARPSTPGADPDLLAPAQLEVSFLPVWLRWLPLGWARYWVIQLAPDGRYAVVSEPTREYLWVLSRTVRLAPADLSAIRSRLAEQGFDVSRLQAHPQSTGLH